MTELGRMLEMYRRRGFESLSEAERHVLSELMLGALVEVQQTCREIHEALRVLDPLSKQVTRLCEWHEEVADGVRDVLEDRRAWKEDVRSIKRSTWEKAVWAALVAIVALLLAIAGIRQVAGQEPTPESSSAAGPSAAGPSASVEVRRDAPSCWAPRPPGAHAEEHAARRLIPRRRAVDEREGRAPRRAVARQLPRAVVHGAQPLRLVPAEGTAPQHPEHLNQ